ncbi:outer membrane beta-barrel protein [bacterium]|nr:outer membrane beta-barrel protein [bacterium]
MRKVGLLIILLLIPVILTAEEVRPQGSDIDIGFKSAGVKVGLVIPNHDNYYNTIGFAGVVFLGSFSKLIHLEAGFRYWNADMDYSGYKDNPYDDGRFSDIMIFPTLKLVPPLKSLPIEPYLGVGLGVNMYKTKPDNADNPIFSEESKTRLEPHFDIGVSYDLIPEIKIVLSAQMNISDISSYYIDLGILFNLEQ